MPAPSSSVLLRMTSRAFLAAIRACEAAIAFLTILFPSVGFSSNQSARRSFVARCTRVLISGLPSLPFVCPSNCGSRIRTEMMATIPSRMSSPVRLSSFSFRMVLRPGVLVDDGREGGAEALDVGPALDRVDAVGEGVDAVGLVAGVPGEGDLDLLAGLVLLEVPDLGEQRLLRLVDVLDEVDDAAGVAVGHRLVVVVLADALVVEADLEALVEEGHHLDPLEDRAGVELDGLEHRGVGPERDGRPAPAPRGVADDVQLLDGPLPPSAKSHPMALAAAVDLDDELGRQRVRRRIRRRRAGRRRPGSPCPRTCRRRPAS